MFNKVKRYLKDPYFSIGYVMIEKCPRLMSDKYYLSVLWKMLMGYELDWKHPKNFNEKLQWLKLYDRKPEYTTMVDKYRAKQWVADRVGEQYVIPTLAVYDSVDEISLDGLPDQFVLKCNHDSGSVVICKDKSSFDLDAAKQKLGAALNKNFYWEAREWPYKNVKRCVFVEKYLSAIDECNPSGVNDVYDISGGESVNDYKFYCFNGEPRIFYITSDKGGNLQTRQDFFDLKGNHLDIEDKNYPCNPRKCPSLPASLSKMIELSRAIARDTYQIRVDFYEINGNPLVGELTFYENAGYCTFAPDEYNRMLGDWIKLPVDENEEVRNI